MEVVGRDRGEATDLLNNTISAATELHGYNSSYVRSLIKGLDLPIQLVSAFGKAEGYDSIGPYRLVDKVQSQGSSTVWMVAREDGSKYYALKVLNGANFGDEIERNSFRRGIESLYFLRGSNVEVAPRYFDHREVPLCVIMTWVDGSTLSDYLGEPNYSFLSGGAQTCLAICRAVDSCHKSEGFVLHRDLKPSNIMLEGWYAGYDLGSTDVRLINFDLSWHKFSTGDTKRISAGDVGYYSPEQRNTRNSDPPRSGLTDVYMLGMILYRMVAQVDPPDGGSTTDGWDDLVRRKVRAKITDKLVSNRISRLIIGMTAVQASERTDLTAVIRELEVVDLYHRGDRYLVDLDLIVEEILVFTGRDYVWDSENLSGHLKQNPEINFKVWFNGRRQRAEIEFSRTRSASDHRGTFGANMTARMQEVVGLLSSSGWDAALSGGTVRILSASKRASELLSDTGTCKNLVKMVADKLLSSVS